jgi:plastocyanin
VDTKAGVETERFGRALIALLVLSALAIAMMLSSSGPVTGQAEASSDSSQTRVLTPAQAKAKAKAMAKCKKIKPKAKRNACIKQVNKRFAPKPAPTGKTWTVDVWDNYYAPGILDVKVNDSVEWVWKEDSREGHNVSLLSAPRGVSPYDFESRILYAEGSSFKRQIKVAGSYTFFCTLHAGMEMQVDARK